MPNQHDISVASKCSFLVLIIISTFFLISISSAFTELYPPYQKPVASVLSHGETGQNKETITNNVYYEPDTRLSAL
jgi:hypothetical protein